MVVVSFFLSRYERLFGQYLGFIVNYCCSYWFMADMFVLWLDYRAKNHCVFDLVVLCCCDLCLGGRGQGLS